MFVLKKCDRCLYQKSVTGVCIREMLQVFVLERCYMCLY